MTCSRDVQRAVTVLDGMNQAPKADTLAQAELVFEHQVRDWRPGVLCRRHRARHFARQPAVCCRSASSVGPPGVVEGILQKRRSTQKAGLPPSKQKDKAL